MKRLIRAALGIVFALAAATASAQAWPNKPVRIIVPYPAGQGTDVAARMFAEQLSRTFGQSFVIENRPGAGGNIAIEAVSKAAPDGYTFLMTTTGAVWQNRVLYTKLPFNLEKDITPVLLYPSGPLVVGVADKVPARNYKEFVEHARQTPVTMGSYAPASHPHMLADYMAKKDGARINTVHYKGESPMWVDVAGGQTQIAVGSYQAFANVAGKGVRPIAVTGTYRSPKLPDIATLQEQNAAGELGTLFGGLPMTAPAGTPQDILQKMAQVALEGWDQPKARQIRESFAIPDPVLGLEDTRKAWRDVAPIWIRQASDLGIKLD